MKQSSQFITLTATDNHILDAYETGNTNAPYTLVVLQEIFGVNHHIQNVCDEFARQGFHVVAPALFDRVQKHVELGYTHEDIQKGLELRAQIAPEKTLLDIIAATKVLQNKKIGVVGYCWGGSLSWRAATETKLFSAASCWYGAMIPSLLEHTPNCPVQMHFGEKDESIPLSEIKKVQHAFPEVEIYVYPDADHGFGCAERKDFDKNAYTLAQQRTLDFFKKNL